ncbi:MAG: flagellar hook-associated protein 3 [Candidatus Hydrogenedentota bacterium]|nr:MAG: flagellar hook-associated protein 3 [Candidatus Hydrogenedentota bacterium]
MTGRVGFGGLVSGLLTRVQDGSERLFELQRKLSTGDAFERTSDDPEAASRARRFDTRIRRHEQLLKNIDTNVRFLQDAEGFVNSTVDQLQRVRTLALQAANGTFVTADQEHIASEINEQLEALVRTANSRILGRSVFAGAETNRDAFNVTRNGIGEITAVSYAGDDVELNVDVLGNVPVTFPGSEVFAAGVRTIKSTSTLFDGSGTERYADRELAASFIPSSGLTEGAIRINGKLISYDLDGNPTSGEGDSLLDLAASINAANAGVTARVTGVMEGTAGVSVPPVDFATEFGGGFRAGTATINGQSLQVNATDTIFSLRDKINALGSGTGVTASVVDAAGNVVDGTPQAGSAAAPLRLRLSGGVSISDDGAADSNIFQLLGITITPPQPAGRNLVGTVTQNYALEITGETPGDFTIEDAQGSLVKDLGLDTQAAVVKDGSVFETLINLRDLLRQGDTDTIRQTILPEIDSALDAVEVTRTETGVRTERMEKQRDRINDLLLVYKEQRSKAKDADLAEVITELRSEQAARQAGLRATTQVLNLTLLNFL